MPRLVVVYRTGGTINYKWHRTVTFISQEEAEACKMGVRLGGREAYVVTEAELNEKGLPQTYEYEETR